MVSVQQGVNFNILMNRLVFATHNSHKLEEIRAIAGEEFEIQGLSDINIAEDIPEDFDSLEKNASQKAWFIHKITGKDCFADDTGLETDALDGEPGVFSARYSRIGSPVYNELPVDEANIKKLLTKLENKKNRRARFRTVVALIKEGEEYIFEGIAEGEILNKPSGKYGFGYDPVFKPSGYSKSFAEMNFSEKNQISHRTLAIRKMIDFLKKKL